jgi:hypothetical protein
VDGRNKSGHDDEVDWVRRRESELMTNWERGRLRQAFEAVPGADVE